MPLSTEKKKRIALIEDEPLARVPLAQALTDSGYEVISAASGVEALDVLDDPRVELAVIDLRLPGRMDGIAVIREARRRNLRLKVILTSGSPPEEDTSDLGEYLPKPFSIDRLREVIARLLGPA